MFKRGDIIECIENRSLEPGQSDYTARLTIGKLYVVLADSHSSVIVLDDNGERCTPYIWRFKLAAHDQSRIIIKIKQMEQRRKQLGYRW